MARDFMLDDDFFSENNSNIAEFTVSELSHALKKSIEDNYSYIRVRGEVGRVSKPGSGHIYLDIKDDKAVLGAVIWRGVASKFKPQIEQGLEVIVTGKLTIYPGQSKYQMVIEHLEPAGVGALMALLEKRKQQFIAEGLFAKDRKKAIPYLPKIIGVITSPTGAVIRDIMHRLENRFPTRVLVWPVRVQGDTCASEVALAINGFNNMDNNSVLPKPDLLIVARGGGSIEDLWAFNEEIVVRAVAESKIPLISAVGHETDWTLIDYVADERAPTPTAAAELSVPVRVELITLLSDLSKRQQIAIYNSFNNRNNILRATLGALPKITDILFVYQQRVDISSLKLEQILKNKIYNNRSKFINIVNRLNSNNIIISYIQKFEFLSTKLLKSLYIIKNNHNNKFTRIIDRISGNSIKLKLDNYDKHLFDLSDRFIASFERLIKLKKIKLDNKLEILHSLSYKSILNRGFALVKNGNDKLLNSVKQLNDENNIIIKFKDGEKFLFIESDNVKVVKRKTKSKIGMNSNKQKSLF